MAKTTGRSVVFLFLHGGPSQVETFDPKMTAPSNIRSVDGEVQTAVPGVTFGSRLPLLAEIFERQRRYADADSTYRAALEQLPLGGAVPGELRRSYGRLLLARGDLARAEEQLLASLELLESTYGGAHPNVHETRRALMELYQRRGRPEPVERYRVPPGRFIPY